MLNRIRSELYRAVHYVSPWVLLAVILSLTCITSYVTCRDKIPQKQAILDGSYAENFENEAEDAEWQSDMGLAILVDSQEEIPYFSPEGTYYLDNEIAMSFNNTLFLLLFTALFCGSLYTSGAVKNIPASRSARTQQLIAIGVVNALWLLLAIVTTTLCVIVFGYFYFHSVAIYSVPTLLSLFGRSFLLQMAMSSLIVMLCVLTKKKTGPLVFGLLASSGTFLPAWTLADWGLQKLYQNFGLNCKFMISEWSIMNNLSGLTPYDHISRNIIVGAVGLLLFLGISFCAIRKKDLV